MHIRQMFWLAKLSSGIASPLFVTEIVVLAWCDQRIRWTIIFSEQSSRVAFCIPSSLCHKTNARQTHIFASRFFGWKFQDNHCSLYQSICSGLSFHWLHTHSHACRHSSMLCTLAALAHQHSKALCFGETLSTLKFAARAKHIRCTVLIWVQKIWNCIKLWHCLLYLALSRFLFEASPSVCFNHRRNNVVRQSEAVMNEEYSGTVESLMLEARRFLLLLLLKCWWVCMWMLCRLSTIQVSDSRGSTKVKSLRQQLDLLSSSHLIFFKFQPLVRLWEGVCIVKGVGRRKTTRAGPYR